MADYRLMRLASLLAGQQSPMAGEPAGPLSGSLMAPPGATHQFSGPAVPQPSLMSRYQDWYNQGGLSGMMGMPSWDQQPLADTLMGFAGTTAGRLKLAPTTARAMELGADKPGRYVYRITGPEGDAGFVDIDWIKDGVARIGDIVTPTGSQSLGLAEIRGLLNQLRQYHPEIKGFSGERVSGARRGGEHGFAGSGHEVGFLLPKSK